MNFSLFPALFDHPSKIKFSQQDPDEHIELLLRRHWITNIGWVFLTLLGLIAPLVFATVGKFLLETLTLSVPNNVTLALLILWYLLILVFAIENYLFWYFNIYIITNERLVDVSFASLLSRQTTEVRLHDVQSARSTLKGLLGSLFNFGDVSVETAAERLNIVFTSVPKPDFVSERINTLTDIQEEEPINVI